MIVDAPDTSSGIIVDASSPPVSVRWPRDVY